MSITKKFAAFEAVIIIILLFTVFLAQSLTLFIFAGLNIVLIGLFIIDVVVSAKASHLTINRNQEEKLYFKADNTIAITVSNNFFRPVNITIKDSLPSFHFTVNKSDLSKIVEPKSSEIFTYDTSPQKRGSFVSENVYLQWEGTLGFCRRYAKVNRPIDYKVYPNVRDLSKFRLIIQKDRLQNYIGRPVKITGAGQEFESLREYVEGDDFRKVNWKATARERKLIVNNYEPEKNQPVVIMVDTGRAMSYSIKGYKKLDYSINSALILADIVNQKGDLSGLIVFDDEVKSVIRSGKGSEHRHNIMEALYHIEDTKNTPDYAEAFNRLNSIQKRRSIVFIFTDFDTFEEAGDMLRHISLISRRHIPIIILMKNENAETLLHIPDKTAESQFVKASAIEFLAERRNIIRKLASSGVKAIECDAENFAVTAVNRYLDVKNRGL